MDYGTLYDTISTGAYAVQYIVSLAASILMIIAQWNINKKANEPGWAAIVPYYNQYVLYKISGKKKLFWAVLALSIGVVVTYIGFIAYIVVCVTEDPSAYSYGEELTGIILAVFLWAGIIFACAIAIFILRIFQCIGLAKNFGLSGGYAVGLIFIPVVFYCIIAFSNKIHYVGDGTYYGAPNGYMPNGQMPYGQAPIYMNSYTGQPQQGYPQNSYGAQQGYPQNPYGAQQGFGQNPYNTQPQGYPQNSYNAQPQGYSQESYNTQPQNYGQNPYSEENDNLTRPNDYNEQ